MTSQNSPSKLEIQHLTEQTAPRYSVKPDIHPEDELFKYTLKNRSPEAAVSEYFRGGDVCAERIGQKIKELGLAKDNATKETGALRVLEFASGFGRVTRHLKNAVEGEIYASDIHPRACQFIEEELSVPTFLSDYEPGRFQCSMKFDFVFALSLFSHLPDHLFGPWLKRLYDCLEVDGVLLVTTIGQTTLKDRSVFWGDKFTKGSDFAYLRTSDQNDLDLDNYGTMAITPNYFTTTLRDHVPDAMLISFQSGCWFAHQDEWLIRKVK